MPARAGARRPARPWPPRSASPTASPRPAGGPARSAAGSARDWPSRWTATRTARTPRGRRPCPRLHAMHLSAGHVAEVLRQAGLLHDDRRPAFDAWLDRKLGGVTAGIRRDAERWLRTLKDGGPRSRPRSIATVHSHLGKALPALLDWSARYHHLREVTRDDIEDHVRGLHGPQRHNALVALRSLFGYCLSAGVIFRNPARGIKVGRRPSFTVLQPLGQEDIDDAVAAAATPAARLIVALAGDPRGPQQHDLRHAAKRRRPGQRPPAPRRPAPPPGRPDRAPAARLARGPPRQMAGNRQPAPAHQRPDRPGHRAGQQDLGLFHPARPRRDHRGPARRPPARGSPRHRSRSRCTSPSPSASTPAPPSATHPAPGSSSRLRPSSKTPPSPPRTQGPEPLKKTEAPSVPVSKPSLRLNSGQSKAPGRNGVVDALFVHLELC